MTKADLEDPSQRNSRCALCHKNYVKCFVNRFFLKQDYMPLQKMDKLIFIRLFWYEFTDLVGVRLTYLRLPGRHGFVIGNLDRNIRDTIFQTFFHFIS